ncbi:MAG: FKBP-type peptidyl-prolyl cis-trans isomerase [Pirellulales bacterium]
MVRTRRLALEGLESRRVMAGLVAVANDAGATATSHIRLLDAETGAQVAATTTPAFEAGFKGGVRLAMGDVTGDGVAEVIAAPGRGRVGEIRVFAREGSTLTELTDFRTQPFGPAYTGGIELVSGDVDGDSLDDVVAAMASGSGTVKVFLAERMPGAAIDGPAAITIQPGFPQGYRGGASVAVADVGTFANGAAVSTTMPDNKMEIVVGSGSGIVPKVLVYDVSNRAAPRLADTITPAAYKNQAGISVTSIRANADIIDDIVVSAGRGGRSFTQIYDGTVSSQDNARIAFFSALGATGRPNAPLFTAAVDTNGDGVIDRFLQSQGDVGGTSGISNVSLAGVRQGAVSGLVGPLRIAAERIGFKTQTTQSGLSYFDVTIGNGVVPTESSLLTVHYTGRYPNGNVFDTSRDGDNTPAVFTLGGVIPGFGEGLSTMRVGGRRILFIPSRIAYDFEARKPAGDLIFEVELLAVR